MVVQEAKLGATVLCMRERQRESKENKRLQKNIEMVITVVPLFFFTSRHYPPLFSPQFSLRVVNICTIYEAKASPEGRVLLAFSVPFFSSHEMRFPLR